MIHHGSLRRASAPEPKPPRAPAAAADWGSPSESARRAARLNSWIYP